MRTTPAARLRACLPLTVMAALVLGVRTYMNPPAPVEAKPAPTSGDAGLFLYYRDVDAMMASGKRMEAVIALDDAPPSPISLARARRLPEFAQGAGPMLLRIADGLAQCAHAAAAVGRRDRAHKYALNCRALALRLRAATGDAESWALAERVQALAESAARAATCA